MASPVRRPLSYGGKHETGGLAWQAAVGIRTTAKGQGRTNDRLDVQPADQHACRRVPSVKRHCHKIAITSLGESLESPVDQRFGRARFFVLYDSQTGAWSAHDNRQNLEAAQGAGVQAARHVMSLGAEAVITGHCGPKAFVALSAADIAVYQEASGSVQDALDAFRAGLLEQASRADVDAGYGSVEAQ